MPPDNTLPLSFFAIVKTDGEDDIRLLKTTQSIQKKLSNIFTNAASDFTNSNLDRVPFSQTYRTDDSEIFCIEDFEMSTAVDAAVREPTSVDELILSSGHIPPIKAIFTGWISDDEQLNVAFQLFKKNQYLTRSGISLVLSSDTFKELSTPGIIISYDLVAFYQAGALLFHSYFQARQVFELGSYYRDATQGDVDEFVAHEKIYITDEDAFNQNADSWIRRKLAIIRDSELLDTVSVSDIKSKAEGFGIDIDLEDIDGESCLKVPDGKKAVKELLRFLDEDYFEGTFSAAKYLSNSKRAAS